MDLDQDIPVISEKDKNVSREERHKWRIPDLPLVPKGNNRDIPVSVQQLVYGGKGARVGTSPKYWIGNMNSYLQVKKFMGPEKTEELLRGWTPMSYKGQVQPIKSWLKNQGMLSEDQKKKLAQGKAKILIKKFQTSQSKPKRLSACDSKPEHKHDSQIP
ncbi:hypothetical protein O181_108425 [Austropuccinia psidii MF-1]|uniref:Uncharacterized protein n=1 Tax=Austropuccinia psidii MF-1 TaxID=1389203 RepID=A0A9Q3JSC3_9BASI|nr:hypothetical protein [Austropuccinia psidii MF-1]